jgi:hypothetical protein
VQPGLIGDVVVQDLEDFAALHEHHRAAETSVVVRISTRPLKLRIQPDN